MKTFEYMIIRCKSHPGIMDDILYQMGREGWDGGGADFSVAWFTWGLEIGRTITWMCHIDNKGKR